MHWINCFLKLLRTFFKKLSGVDYHQRTRYCELTSKEFLGWTRCTRWKAKIMDINVKIHFSICYIKHLQFSVTVNHPIWSWMNSQTEFRSLKVPIVAQTPTSLILLKSHNYGHSKIISCLYGSRSWLAPFKFIELPVTQKIGNLNIQAIETSFYC